MSGSSPLARGKRRAELLPPPALRLIPAHAGTMDRWQILRFAVAAHPRSRGDHIPLVGDDNAVKGSSPLTRGTHEPTDVLLRPLWLIPAHAGTTRLRAVPCSRTWAPPRTRGDDAVMRKAACLASGSSPHTRGRLKAVVENVLAPRLLPAHAGTTVQQEMTSR